MVEPSEAAKPSNWDALLGSLAAFFMALSGWLYRKAGKAPRTEAGSEPHWDTLLEKIEEINRKLGENHDMQVRMDERVIRLEQRFDSLGRRFAKMEGNQAIGD